MNQRTDASLEVQVCQKAAEAAEAIGPGHDFIQRRLAFTYAAMAYRDNRQPEKALGFADQAIAVAQEKETEGGSGLPGAYFSRAQIEASFNEFQKSSEDLSKTEELGRNVLANMTAPAQQQARALYSQWLKHVFEDHAKVLESQGKQGEAAGKRAEAAQL